MWMFCVYLLIFPQLLVLSRAEVLISHLPSTIQFENGALLSESDALIVISALFGFSRKPTSTTAAINSFAITNPFKIPAILIICLRQSNNHDDAMHNNAPDNCGYLIHALNTELLNLLNGECRLVARNIFGDLQNEVNSELNDINTENDLIYSGHSQNEDSSLNYVSGTERQCPIIRSLNVSISTADDDEFTTLLDYITSKTSTVVNDSQKDNLLVMNVVNGKIKSTGLNRRIREATVNDEEMDINVAKNYESNYPIIFNIILWFTVIMIFALLAVSIAIASMDPGRDSIIYRMTSTRMKKDN